MLSVLRILWQSRRHVALAWMVATVLAILIVRSMPPVYRAEAVVLVDSQKIPEVFVSPTVNGDVADRLALLTQTIMTSERLLNIIQQFNLYPKERARLTHEELLQKTRSDISVTVEKSWTGGHMQAFRLAYQGPDAKAAARVANRLASLYVDENVRARESQAEGTVDFLRQQLAEAKASLDEQEAKVAAFKQVHNGSLPEQQASLLGTLNSLSVQLEGVGASMARAHENRIALEGALAAAESSQASMRANLRRAQGDGAVSTGGGGTGVALRSDVLADQLRVMKLHYTDDYPAVQTLEAQLAQVKRSEEEQEPLAGTGPAEAKSKAAPAPPELLLQNERVVNLHSQLAVTNQQVQAFEKERAQLNAGVAQTQAQIAKLPLVEQEMAGLKRNYDESASNYKSLLQKQLAAGMATDMERLQKSERFTISDAARVPEQPVRPKRALLMVAGSFVSLLVACLVAFLLGYRRQVFLGEWELPPDITVLGRVPAIRLASEQGRA